MRKDVCKRVLQSVAVSCSVLQCVAVCVCAYKDVCCCSVLQCVAVHCSVLHCVTVCVCACKDVCKRTHKDLCICEETLCILPKTQL